MAAVHSHRGRFLPGLFAHVLLCAVAFATVSCDLVKPTDRSFNAGTQPVDIGALDPSQIRTGQHVAGIVALQTSSLDLQSLSSAVHHVELIVDSTVVASAVSPPYTVTVDTRNWPDGDHVLGLAIHEIEPKTGLIGMVGFPTVVRAVPVVFDQTPPTPVTLTSVEWDGDAPLLTWTASGDSNFYAYAISRQGNWGGNFYPPNTIPAGPLVRGRDSLSYRDVQLGAPVIGIHVDYQVHVFNRAEAAASNVVTIEYGQSIPSLTPDLTSTAGLVPRPVVSPTMDEFYVLFQDTLRAYSSLTQLPTRRVALRSRNFGVSRDGTRIFAFTYEPAFQQNSLEVLSAASFAVVASLPTPAQVNNSDYSIAAGRDDRVYVTTFNSIQAVNVDTGASSGQLPLNSFQTKLAISPDGNTLYASVSDSLYRIDVTTDALAFTERLGVTHSIADLQISPDGQDLYLEHVYGAPSNFVEVRDPATFAARGQVGAPVGEQHFSFWVTASHLYLANSRADPKGIYFLSGRVVQYDRSSLASLRSWDLVQVPRWVVTSHDEQSLYAEGFRTWTFPISSSVPFLSRR